MVWTAGASIGRCVAAPGQAPTAISMSWTHFSGVSSCGQWGSRRRHNSHAREILRADFASKTLHPQCAINRIQSCQLSLKSPRLVSSIPPPMPLRPTTRLSTATRRLQHLSSTLSTANGTYSPSPPSTPTTPTTHRAFTMTSKTQEPVITATRDLPINEARWVTLKQLTYTDQTGKSRTWEVAQRKTRASSAGVDAVAIGNILLPPPSQQGKTPVSTMLVIQYRPPLDAYTVEWPAGLIDEGETAEAAARREFKEETGYEVTKVLSVSPVQAADPGMTNANMQMAMVEVQLPEMSAENSKKEEGEAALPLQRLDDGEHITRVVVPLAEMYDRLVEYAGKERMVVAAKLFHFAAGMQFMRDQKYF